MKFKSNFNFLIYFVILFIIFFSISQTYNVHLDNLNTKARNDRNNIIKLINKINFKDVTTLLTFDKKIMTWSILRIFSESPQYS